MFILQLAAGLLDLFPMLIRELKTFKRQLLVQIRVCSAFLIEFVLDFGEGLSEALIVVQTMHLVKFVQLARLKAVFNENLILNALLGHEHLHLHLILIEA